MKTIGWTMAVLVLIWLSVMPAAAGELRVTGYIDNVVETDQNISNTEDNLTNNKDKVTFGSTRAQIFFNFIASDDLRGVWALEMDSAWGAPARDRLTSASRTPVEAGFRLTNDINNIEVKELYVDFHLPQLPFGNRWHVGGMRTTLTPLHPNVLFTHDVGGVDTVLNFTPEVSLKLMYIQLEEDVERFPGSTKIGEDYVTGANLMLKPLPGWDLHLPFLLEHIQAPTGADLTGLGAPYNISPRPGDPLNIVAEDRYYFGVDSRYRLGNLSIEPSFIYQTSKIKFCRPGSTIAGAIVTTTGTPGTVLAPTMCTSATPAQGGVRELDQSGYQGLLELNYTMGKWLLSGKYGYVTGDSARVDLHNQGLTQGRIHEDMKGYRAPGPEGGSQVADWLDILGRGELLSARTVVTPYRFAEAAAPGVGGFGYETIAGKAEVKLTDKTLLRGIAGAVWSAKVPACPAVLRTGTITSTNPLGCSDSNFNFTGNTRYMGSEVDMHLQYTIMPGLVNIVGGGWAFIGDGFAINNRKPQDAWLLLNRLLYVF